MDLIIKLTFLLIKHGDVKNYWGVEVQLHTLSTLTLEEISDQWVTWVRLGRS
jgi:hypothetical protein